MTNRELKSIKAKIDRHMKQLAKDRDYLDKTISELEGLKDCCDRAYDALWDARDALSELV